MSPIVLIAYAPIIAIIFYAVLGFLFGGYAEKKTFCMVVATHQVMGVRRSSIYEMILVSIAVASLGTGILVGIGAVPVVDAYAFLPGAGWYTLLGSFIFGFGMMLGQGCMVGMLWKSGSGYVVNWVEILGLALGSIIFAFPVFNWLNLSYWWKASVTANVPNSSPVNYIPNLLAGMPATYGALIVGVVFFAAVMWIAMILRKRRIRDNPKNDKGWKSIIRSPYFSGFLFSMAMIASFIFAAGHSFNYLGVTTPVALFSQYILSPAGIFLGSKSVPTNWYQSIPIIGSFSFFILMIIAGSSIFSMGRGTFRIRLPSGSASKLGDLTIGFTGGIIIAIGARIAQGCSVGGFWSGLAGLSLFGLVFTVGIILGSVAGYYAYIFLSSKMSSKSSRKSIAKEPSSWRIALTQYTFSVIFGLILISIGIESKIANGQYNTKIPSALMAQESETMVILGIVVMMLGIIITTAQHFKLAAKNKMTTTLEAR